MDGSGFGKAMGDAIIGLAIMAFIAGGVVFAVLWFGGSWLFRHLSIGWH
jgi:hypothetical protein